MDKATVDFLYMVDWEKGMHVYHLIPLNQPGHIATTECLCRPHLEHIREMSPRRFIEIWWHWEQRPSERREQPDA